MCYVHFLGLSTFSWKLHNFHQITITWWNIDCLLELLVCWTFTDFFLIRTFVQWSFNEMQWVSQSSSLHTKYTFHIFQLQEYCLTHFYRCEDYKYWQIPLRSLVKLESFEIYWDLYYSRNFVLRPGPHYLVHEQQIGRYDSNIPKCL